VKLSKAQLVLLICAALLGAPSFAAAESRGEPAAAKAERPARPLPRGAQPGTEAEARSYAEREKSARDLESFEGGRGGSIELTTLLIIVLVVLLVVLIV
jgi:hypothetical protein